ncbi:MAG: DMT family transporter [Lachnospiraceae bacterium]|nr:DMT family transporter [Lachnospiraceae bacterium]MCD7766401.1 DMT family transporter [Lachnospiraceae bacterium]
MKKTSMKSSLTLLLTAVIWGVAFVAQSVGMDYVEPFTFSFTRCILGGLVLIPCIALMDRQKGKQEREREKTGGSVNTENAACLNGAAEQEKNCKDKAERRTLLAGGVCCGIALCVASNLQQIGIQYTSVGKAGFITALYIVLVPVIEIFLGKKSGIRTWISVVIAVAGLYLLCITDGFSIGTGDILILLCALAFSVHILVIDYFSPKVDGVRMSCIQFFVCGILSGIAMLIFETPSVGAVMQAWLPIGYAGILSCGVAYTLQIIGQKGTDPTVASLILSLESVVSVLSGWLILHQSLSRKELLGCVLMFLAIILVQLPQKETGTEH